MLTELMIKCMCVMCNLLLNSLSLQTLQVSMLVFNRQFISYMGIDDWKCKLVGFGSDGANVNIWQLVPYGDIRHSVGCCLLVPST